jgi:hypothetical protein
MIFDKEMLFSDKQNVTANAASDNVVDLGVARDMGKGEPIPLRIQLTSDAGGTNPTLDVKVQQDGDAAFSDPTDVKSASQISGGSAGDTADIYIWPRDISERYVRVYYTVGGTSPDYDITAGVVADHQEGHTD